MKMTFIRLVVRHILKTYRYSGSVNMKLLIAAFAGLSFVSFAHAAGDVILGNQAWPPYINEGQDKGTAETLVCEALSRAGWQCSVVVDDWQNVLRLSSSGEIDGIAATWHTPQRERFFVFSDAYLTNRIVPAVTTRSGIDIQGTDNLAGYRVAMNSDYYAYGSDIEAYKKSFKVVAVDGPKGAIKALREGRADIALIDELAARDLLGDSTDIEVKDIVLTYRELHFAISRQHPQAGAIVSDFHRTFEVMLQDGTVNNILNVQWLVTDLGNDGSLDLVLRRNESLEGLTNPLARESTYALGQSEHYKLRQEGLDTSQLKFQVDGESHSDLNSALNSAFGDNTSCRHVDWSSTFKCNLPTAPARE
jgi:polar amino acid transport system substrate-binding protein